MNLNLIETEDQYEECLEWIDNQFDKKHLPESLEGNSLLKILELVKDYEDKHYPILSV